jgi:hypothetical protein
MYELSKIRQVAKHASMHHREQRHLSHHDAKPSTETEIAFHSIMQWANANRTQNPMTALVVADMLQVAPNATKVVESRMISHSIT